jgi:hypothetical protein
MWSVKSINLIEQQFGNWYVSATFSKDDGTERTEYLNFGNTEPTQEQIDAKTAEIANIKSLAEAADVSPRQSISREEFFGRFTVEEVAAVYAAAQTTPLVMAYVKRMEMNPTIHRDNPDVQAGLPLLEAAQLIAPGRAAEILNW